MRAVKVIQSAVVIVFFVSGCVVSQIGPGCQRGDVIVDAPPPH